MKRLYLDQDRTIEAQISSDASLQTDQINFKNKNQINMKDLGFYFSLYCQQIKKQLNKYFNQIVRDLHSHVEMFLDQQSDKSKDSEQFLDKELMQQLKSWRVRLQLFQERFYQLKIDLPYFQQKKKHSKFENRKIKFLEILERFLNKAKKPPQNHREQSKTDSSKLLFDNQLSQIQDLYDRNQFEEAILRVNHLSKKSNQSHPQVNFIRGNCYKAMGKYQDAIKQYGKAIEVNPRGCYYNNRGNCFLCLQKVQLAQHDYKKAIEYEPNNEVFLGNYGNVCLSLKKFIEAIGLYNKALKLGSQNDFFYNNKAFAEIKLKKYEDAIDSYSKAIQLSPYNHVYLKNRANLYMQIKMIKQAIDDVDKAIDIQPNKHEYFYLKGKWEYMLGKHRQSMHSFRKACQLQPKKQIYKDYYLAIKTELGLN